MNCAKKEKTADNCLVICFGVSKYEKRSKIPDIEDVKDDINSYTTTFKANQNCKVISNDINKIYTQKMIIKYFENIFIEYLYNIKTNEIRYNSLIITISGHCTETALICSNGQKLQFTKILSIFTNNWENRKLISNLPKFIIVDGQRGFDYLSKSIQYATSASVSSSEDEKQQQQEYQDLAYILMEKNIMDTYSCIMTSVSAVLDSSAYSGQLSWNLTQILNETFKKQQDIIFYDIVNKLRQRINKASDYSDYQFSIDFIEHDMDIDDVVFTSKQSIKLNDKKNNNNTIQGYDEKRLKQLVKQREKERKQKKKENKNKTARFKRSKSLGLLTSVGGNNDNKKNKKSSRKDKKLKSSKNLFGTKEFNHRSKSPLSPRSLFKNRNPSKTMSPTSPSNDSNNGGFPSTDNIEHDPLFKDTIEWDKSTQILSQSKDKTRVKVEWLFKFKNKSHCVTFNHSQKSNPYIKAKRVLSIDGKQIWSQKTTATQFTEMHNGNVLMISIEYNDEKKQFSYDLKINNKTFKQRFNEWTKQNMFVE